MVREAAKEEITAHQAARRQRGWQPRTRNSVPGLSDSYQAPAMVTFSSALLKVSLLGSPGQMGVHLPARALGVPPAAHHKKQSHPAYSWVLPRAETSAAGQKNIFLI